MEFSPAYSGTDSRVGVNNEEDLGCVLGRACALSRSRLHVCPPFHPPPLHNVALAQTADTPTPVPTVTPTPEQPDESAIHDLLALEGKLNPPQYPNMDSNLNQLVQEAEQGGLTAQAMTAAAGSAPIHREQSVAVTLYIEDGYVNAIAAYLEDNGASPRNIGTDYIEAYVPVSLLPGASEQEGVLSIRTIIPPQQAQGMVVSEGAALHGAPAWHAADIRGQGTKIGVIDAGFEGFSLLMGTELPVTVQARCYTDIGEFSSSLSGCDNSGESEHGTAVTETVFDIAPEANYFISNPISYGDLTSTIRWMVEQDVDVINYSLTDLWQGPGDGTSPFSNSVFVSVNTAVTGSITWVSATGNHARDTWFGTPDMKPIVPGSSIRWQHWNGTDHNNCMRLTGGEAIIVQLRWDDTWNGARIDLDLVLWDSAFNIVGSSRDIQAGLLNRDIPREVIFYTPVASGSYCLTVTTRDSSVPSWMQMQVRNSSSYLQYNTVSGSIGSPAESANPGLLAVGATHYWNTRAIADYSSQGPTPDGRIKPDIVGTACGEVASYGVEPLDGNDCWFPGTSQAAPHVAGLASLVKQRFPSYSPRQVARYLKDHAEERGVAGSDNVWGYGFARLPASVPTPTVTATPTATPADVDKDALIAFYNATNGAGWTDNTNWLDDAVPLSSWHGVHTDADGRVTVLSLSSNNLTGSLPTELGSLTKLRQLLLGGNQLSGALPVELGSLANLTHLYLGYNRLTGAIPAELGSLTNLERLHLDNNRLNGAVPSELGNLSSIRTIYLQGNQLTGALPQTFANLASLEVFAFDNGDAGLCAPTNTAFQNWLQSVSNKDIAAGVKPLGPNCTTPSITPTPMPSPSPTSIPTPVPTATPTPTSVPTQPAVPPEVLSRISVLETLVATLQGLISTLEGKITTLDRRVTVLETNASAPTPNPTATPSPTPTIVPGEPTPIPTPTPTLTPTPTVTPITDVCVTPVAGAGVITASWIDTCQSTNRPLAPDKPDDGTYYARYYTFDLSAPSLVTIRLESSEDTFLYLLNGTGKTGSVAHFNDDIEVGLNTNSQIDQTLQAGSYTIEAATYKSGVTGSSFTLTVSGIE